MVGILGTTAAVFPSLITGSDLTLANVGPEIADLYAFPFTCKAEKKKAKCQKKNTNTAEKTLKL